jgi:hypothetical protein
VGCDGKKPHGTDDLKARHLVKTAPPDYCGGNSNDQFSLRGTCLAHVPSNLFLETTAVEVANANRRPSKLSHDFRELAICASTTLALWHLQKIHQRLAADTLETIEPGRPAHTLEPQPPRVYGLCGFSCSDVHFV